MMPGKHDAEDPGGYTAARPLSITNPLLYRGAQYWQHTEVADQAFFYSKSDSMMVITDASVEVSGKAVRGRSNLWRGQHLAAKTRTLPDVENLSADLVGQPASCMGVHEHIIIGPGEALQLINATWGSGDTTVFTLRFVEVKV